MTEPVPDHKRWNYNIHYQRPLLAELPLDDASTALDVGCGDGMIARELAERGLQVTAIDKDGDSIGRARAQGSERIEYLEGDVLTTPLPREHFDIVTAVAVLHHMDIRDGLERLRDLVAPGGTLAVVGLAFSDWPRELPRDVAASFVDKAYRLGRTFWDHGGPTVWPPPHTFRDVRLTAEELLPGVLYERKLMWRYTLTWVRSAPIDGS